MNTFKPKRIQLNQVCGIIVDVQDSFLSQIAAPERQRLEINTQGFAFMLSYLKIPILATLEKPLEQKGQMPDGLRQQLEGYEHSEVFHKEYFDLTRHRDITTYLRALKKRQVLLAGCETDVCVLQSCLGLIDLGYEVFVVEDLLFSSSTNVSAATERMKNAGAVFISLKTAYYELTEAVAESPQRQKLVDKFGPFPNEM